MRPNQAEEELQRALSELLDGTLDSPSRRRLNARLRDDPKARELYFEYCETHASLAWEHGLVLGDVSPTHVTQREESTASRVAAVSRWRFIVAPLTALAAVTLFVLIWSRRDGGVSTDRVGPVVAELVDRIDARIRRGDESWDSNQLRAGRYAVERGLIRLQFATGVIVLIESPADFEAISNEKLVLYSGRLSATVPPEGIGFTVETPEAEVVDFGTEFSVEVGTGESEVHVYQGHVRVNPKVDDPVQSPSVDLRTEQAIRINDSTRRPSGIDLAKDRFIRSIEEPQHRYPKMVKQLQPVAYYRMPIKARGLACSPNRYRGEVLTGRGSRPACAPGICGASLRMGGRSVGRGARVAEAAKLRGPMTVSGWVYAESRPELAMIATDEPYLGRILPARNEAGESPEVSGSSTNVGLDSHEKGQCRFAIGLDAQNGALFVQVNEKNGGVSSCVDSVPLALSRWQHVAVTDDGERLRLYRNGMLVAEATHGPLYLPETSSLWIGTDSDGCHLWDGRIDELAIFDRVLTQQELAEMNAAADRS